MIAISVNGHPLPPRLLELIASGRWQRPDDLSRVRELTGLSDARDLFFCSPESMRRNTDELYRMSPEVFGLGRGPGLLDPAFAVVIAVTPGQGMVCLDYRAVGEPSVVVSHRGRGAERWRVIGPDLATFATALGL